MAEPLDGLIAACFILDRQAVQSVEANFELTSP